MEEQVEKRIPSRIKPYKAKKPSDTVAAVRRILAEMDILVYESPIHYKADGIFAFHLTISDGDLDQLTKLGTKGKGMSRSYALASAYGEFMERFQNCLFFPSIPFPRVHEDKNNSLSMVNKIVKMNSAKAFKSAPDEKQVKIDDHIHLWQKCFFNIFGDDNQFITDYLGKNEVSSIPFYDLKNKNVCYLPSKLLLDSGNGMCAGNSKEEAMIQGISEILERYAFARIYFEKITPPNIPLEFFKGHVIYDRIKKLEKDFNVSIIIKDCSLGMGLPVIGTLIIDKNNHRYSFHLGADPSPITALERNITEEIQVGFTDNMEVIKIRKREDSSKINKELLNYFWLALSYRQGDYPDSIFSNKESYPFEGLSYFHHGNSDKEDLDFLIKKISNLGYSIYIRDVSFLGFPSYKIFIPGMCDNYYDYMENKKDILMNRKSLPDIFNLIDASDDQIKDFAKSLEKAYENGDAYFLNFKFGYRYIIPPKPIDLMYIMIAEYLLAVLYYSLSSYDKALYYLTHFIESRNERDNYLYCFRDLIILKKDNVETLDTIKERLSLYYNDELVHKIIEEFGIENEAMGKQLLPRCFNCHLCNLKDNCRYEEILKYRSNSMKKLNDNPINQLDLTDLFEIEEPAYNL